MTFLRRCVLVGRYKHTVGYCRPVKDGEVVKDSEKWVKDDLWPSGELWKCVGEKHSVADCYDECDKDKDCAA